MKMASLALLLVLGASGAWADTSIRVMSYNIHHGEGMDKKVDLERIAAIIRAENPDVVCLQEVDSKVERTQKIDMPAEFAKLLDMQVAYGPNLELQGGKYGNATLTKLKVLAEENLRLPIQRGDEPRGCLRVRVEKDGATVDIYNAHFGLSDTQRRMQASAVIDRLGSIPAILAGDLNAQPDETPILTLTGVLTDTFAKAGSDQPAKRIDYVLVSKHVNPLSFRVVVTPETEVASDHHPVVADVGLEVPVPGAEAQGIDDAKDERINEALGE